MTKISLIIKIYDLQRWNQDQKTCSNIDTTISQAPKVNATNKQAKTNSNKINSQVNTKNKSQGYIVART